MASDKSAEQLLQRAVIGGFGLSHSRQIRASTVRSATSGSSSSTSPGARSTVASAPVGSPGAVDEETSARSLRLLAVRTASTVASASVLGGVSATGVSATGVSATGVSATGVSATGASCCLDGVELVGAVDSSSASVLGAGALAGCLADPAACERAEGADASVWGDQRNAPARTTPDSTHRPSAIWPPVDTVAVSGMRRCAQGSATAPSTSDISVSLTSSWMAPQTMLCRPAVAWRNMKGGTLNSAPATTTARARRGRSLSAASMRLAAAGWSTALKKNSRSPLATRSPLPSLYSALRTLTIPPQS